jgi:hypothetical protein
MTTLITKMLGPPEEIDAWDSCSTHLYRWTIFGNKRFNVYLDHFVGEHWSGNLHSYPDHFISVGLAESYPTETRNALNAFANRAAWMVLIGESSLGVHNTAHH